MSQATRPTRPSLPSLYNSSPTEYVQIIVYLVAGNSRVLFKKNTCSAHNNRTFSDQLPGHFCLCLANFSIKTTIR